MRGEQVLIVLNRDRGIAAAEDVVLAPVAAIERARVAAVEEVHRHGKALGAGSEEKVVVVRHQAVARASQLEAGDGSVEEGQENPPVVRIAEELAPVVATRGDVVRQIWIEHAWRSRHLTTVGESHESRGPRAADDTLS